MSGGAVTAVVVSVLRSARERIATPRRWLQGVGFGRRTADGRIIPGWAPGSTAKNATCWCVGEAINLALDKLEAESALGSSTWTELRSEAERQLLLTLDELGVVDGEGNKYPAIAHYNDALTTSHADVLMVIDRTLGRLPEAA